jgi:hypothetical protein
MSHTLDPNRLQEIWDAIEENGINLTTWEIDWIESVKPRWEKGYKLSDKEMEILERIYIQRVP